jgi:hypothetical protein
MLKLLLIPQFLLGVGDLSVNVICNVKLTLGPKRQIILCWDKQPLFVRSAQRRFLNNFSRFD